ncbi:MarP family serine protease [Rathayibacter tanaceti]|uniref:Serine protease n=2 Tax=Rathayibacter tanaceti TaxID=1671680 RepID=A0A166HZ01_9MICO|nr:MarP family serine protease [Rathayibacter tanaceti]KZX21371.1 Serine protease [Rathayibacter tanaceti]QHC54379.1 MarP family serine protease [Rathayibacter tanaceti]TCO38062.1 colicin V production protein [Rathayibacter tanaceti]
MGASVIVDVIVVLSLLGALVDGLRRGFLRTVGGLAGVVAGAIGASFAVPAVSSWTAGTEWRLLAVIGTAVLLLGVGYAVGATLGAVIGRGADRVKLGLLDRLAGGGAGVAITGLVWIAVTSAVSLLGVPLVTTSVAGSTVIRGIDDLTPSPVRGFLAQLQSTVVDRGTSWVVAALDAPTEAPAIPDVATDDPEVAGASRSVVRVSGTAWACDVGVTGSGFVSSDDRVITNAHVVAGVAEPVVEAPGEAPRTGRVVYANAATDLAVIAVDGLDAAPLALDDSVVGGDDAVVAGYPFGGPLTLGSAQVSSDTTVSLMVDGTPTSREVLTLAAVVNQGNSGGPLLSLDGTVSGVVFGKAASVDNVGYAIPLSVLSPVVTEAPALTGAVDPGACRSR